MKEVYISNLAIKPLIEYLQENGYHINIVDGEACLVDPRIGTHPDLYMCQMGLYEGSSILHGSNIPTAPYPKDAIYNAIVTDKFFVHNFKISAQDLLDNITSIKSTNAFQLTHVHVAQGYSRCNCLPVDDYSFITSDAGMAKALTSAGADVLLIQPKHIKLQGFPYGFIGGCAGNLIINGRRTIVFNGDLSSHPDYKKITTFIKDRDIDIEFFSGYQLEDIGSILLSYF